MTPVTLEFTTSTCFRIKELGFWVKDLGVRVKELGFRVEESTFGLKNRFWVEGLGT